MTVFCTLHGMNHRAVTLLNRFRVELAIGGLLLTQAFLLGWIATVNSPALDEPGHLVSGLSHWKLGNFDLYRVNPPVTRLISAAPLLLANLRTDWSECSNHPLDRPEFNVAMRFIESNGRDSFWYFVLGRWVQIPVALLGGWICFRWAAELSGKSAGLTALFLWCFCPNVLAWGAAITPDLGATVFGLVAAYTFWRWLKNPGWMWALIAGVGLGLAEASKTTWIVLFALWPMLWLVWRIDSRREAVAKPSALQLAAILLLGVYCIILSYGFENSFQPLGRMTFISRSLKGPEETSKIGNRFREHWIGSLPVPVPANYLKGIDVQKRDFELGKWAYLRGEHQFGGWYHYYLYGLAVKTPIGTLALLGAAVLMAVFGRSRIRFRDHLILLVPALLVLAIVSSQTGLNRHVRYVLPVVPFLLVYAGQLGCAFESGRIVTRVFCGVCLTATAIGSMSVFPHSMSFFNSLAGGPRGGPGHLLDSNIDWGQDLLELKRFVDRHPEIDSVNLSYCGSIDPKITGLHFERIPRLNRNDNWKGAENLKPGWYAISVNHLFGYYFNGPGSPDYSCFQRLDPDGMAGYSIYIYHITPDILDRLVKSTSRGQ